MPLTLGASVFAAVALTATQASAVDKLVTLTMAAEHIAGATVAVARDGTIVYERGFGYANLSTKTPATANTIYPIGSITKQFTAAAILLLAQDGKLSIDDPLSKYVNGLPWGGRVTLRHLLDQESGVVEFRLGVFDVTAPVTQTAVLDRLKETDLRFPPGSQFAYSNSNYYLLGLVVEKVAGHPYQRFLQTRILTTLGLASTYYNDASVPAAALASGYNATPDGPQPVPAENPDWAFSAGAIASTAADLTRWDDALRGDALLNGASRRAMFSPGILDDGSATDYALGWEVVRHDGHAEVWHNGEVTGFHAMNAMYPDDGIDIVVLTNTGATFAADELAVQIFDVIHPFAPSAQDKAAAARAKEWLKRIARADVDRTQLTDEMSAALSGPVVSSAGEQLRALGAMKAMAMTGVDQDASGRTYSFRVTFTKQAIRWVMGVDAQGKISALYFRL